MKNSRWIGNRIGLIDFWYYDEQEFTFADGRMLLRGANGSGKSVTMQSFIPLLLDGNMRPERLDPFGSKARKMENYLLEEDDGREERTGYLYMEFKREESETYLTFGIGLRARRGKKLDTWYFCITDGRRIGRDFLLYKELSEKLVLTKTELKNRIGEGGRLMESQGEYMKCVNDMLFGFETVDEYKELLDLLIQLRTPKLSKEFRPSIINEILSKSLQTLSEEDLRPMSEAIENMDSIETNLKTLAESLKAAKDIKRVYDQYNRAVLLDKADSYLQTSRDYDRKETEVKGLETSIAGDREELKKEERHYGELENEYQILDREYETLRESDAAALKEEENRLTEEKRQRETEFKDKETKIESKKQERMEKANAAKEKRQENEKLWDDILRELSEVEKLMEGASFDEWKYLKKELSDAPSEKYDFTYQQERLREYMDKVKEGIQILQKEAAHRRRYDEILQELDEKKEEREQKERELGQYERLLREQKDELTEAVYQWADGSKLLHMQPEQLQDIARKIEAYRYGDDFAAVRDIPRGQKQSIEDGLRQKRSALIFDRKTVEGQRDELEQKIHEWQNKKEAEPERTEEVIRSRKRLKELGIPVLPLYKVIDFDGQVPERQRDRLEAALYHMGILDALVVDRDYREQIRVLDEDLCDQYLFSDIAGVEHSLIEIMSVDNADSDLLLYQQVTTILSGIGFTETPDNGGTWVDADGRYRLGVVEGSVPSDYRSRYIGAAARERHRLAVIQELTEEKLRLSESIVSLDEQIASVEEELHTLEEELARFPEEGDVKEAARGCADAEHELGLLRQEIDKITGRLNREEEAIRELAKQVQDICAKTGLANRLVVFEETLAHLEEYSEALGRIRVWHSQYLNGLELARTFTETVEGLDADLDDLLYEQGRLRNQLDKCAGELASVREQLALTNYEEIRERLDYCIKRRGEIPREREASRARTGSLESTIESSRERLHEAEEELLKKDAVRGKLEEVFLAEHRLGYVSYDFVKTEEAKDLAGKVHAMLHGQLGSKTQGSLFGDLQEVYHRQKGFLSEYQPTLCNLFEEMCGASLSGIVRLDIKTKYRGSDISFRDLVAQLETDVAELKGLLSEKDRELFEDILSNTISKKIRARIYESRRWVDGMNRLMESMQTSSGLKLSLRWVSKKSEKEDQLDTEELVELLQGDAEIMRQEDIDKMSMHFRSRIAEARKLSREENNLQSLHVIMKEILDYRKWFEFQLYFQKAGERKRELTDRMFFTFSGGEKAMSMYVPLFSAVVAKYGGAKDDAPMMISLDEAFAGVDEMNIRDMFRLMIRLNLSFIINSQVLWGDYDTVPSLAIYHLARPLNAKSVTVFQYLWNGKEKFLVTE